MNIRHAFGNTSGDGALLVVSGMDSISPSFEMIEGSKSFLLTEGIPFGFSQIFGHHL
jgi:hypothetical protein